MKEDYQIDIEHVESMLESELSGIELNVTERNIGNGTQYAIEAYKQDSSIQVLESQWYQKDEFEAFCDGMKHLERLDRIARITIFGGQLQ